MIHTLIDIFNNPNTKYNNLEKIHQELVEIAAHSNYKERQANDAEKDYMDLKMAQYMKQHENEEFNGIILDIPQDNIYIKLDNNIRCILANAGDFALSFDVDSNHKTLTCKYSKKQVKLGTKVTVKVTIIDIPQKKIFVDIKDIIKNYTKSYVKKV